MSYHCKHFSIEELVSPEAFNLLHEDALWSMLDDDALIALDWLRERYGRATVNNWKWGGPRKQSGLRTRDSKHYSEGSQHSIGCAFDVIFSNHSAQYVREDLAIFEASGGEIPRGIRRIERGVSWFHFDCKETGQDKIYCFNP